MISDERLIGWLCMIRLNVQGGVVCPIKAPSEVHERLVAAGWVQWDESDLGKTCIVFTEEGLAISDLNAPEWGIDPVGAL